MIITSFSHSSHRFKIDHYCKKVNPVRSEYLMVVTTNICIFWDVMIEVYIGFRAKSVNICQTRLCYMLYDSTPHIQTLFWDSKTLVSIKILTDFFLQSPPYDFHNKIKCVRTIIIFGKLTERKTWGRPRFQHHGIWYAVNF